MFRLAPLLALPLVAISTTAADLPRYQLPVGRVLHYSGEGTSKERDAKVPASTAKSSWRLTVLAKNDDGSARVLARSTESYSHQGVASPDRVTSACFDLYPDGRYRIDRQLAMTITPDLIFPRLPADAAQTAKEWQSAIDWKGSQTTFTPQSAQGAEFVFTGVQDGPTNRIYIVTQKATNHFDTAKGILTRVDAEYSQDYGFHSEGTSTLKLDKEETLPAERAQALAREYALYIDAVKEYADQMKRLNEQPDQAQQIIDAAKLALTTASEKVQHPDVKQEFKTKLEEHDRYAGYSVEQAKRLAGVLNKPAADWSAKDLNDQPISAKSLRGKVVVMDFWYRGCGWCIYAMPQVKQLAADFKDKPVAILGMNTDRDLDDARFVVKQLALDYPQVQATGIPEKFAVQGFPTLIIIDQEGKVRDLHVGYSPDLREQVSKKIQTLLSANDAKP